MALDLTGVDLLAQELRTERLLLRPWRDDDEDAVLRAWQDEDIQRWVLAVPVPPTPQDARRYVRERTTAVRAEGRGLNGAVEAAGEVIGGAGIYGLDRTGRLGPEIGYFVAPWGRGHRYAAEIARALADWAFGLGAPRVHLFTDVTNAASQAVARRAGFAAEGRVRSALAYRDGRRADAVLFGRVPGE